MGGKTPQSPPAPPEDKPLPSVEETKQPVAKSIREEETRKLRARRGVSGTVLTSPLGTDKNTLLGG